MESLNDPSIILFVYLIASCSFSLLKKKFVDVKDTQFIRDYGEKGWNVARSFSWFAFIIAGIYLQTLVIWIIFFQK